MILGMVVAGRVGSIGVVRVRHCMRRFVMLVLGMCAPMREGYEKRGPGVLYSRMLR